MTEFDSSSFDLRLEAKAARVRETREFKKESLASYAASRVAPSPFDINSPEAQSLDDASFGSVFGVEELSRRQVTRNDAIRAENVRQTNRTSGEILGDSLIGVANTTNTLASGLAQSAAGIGQGTLDSELMRRATSYVDKNLPLSSTPVIGEYLPESRQVFADDVRNLLAQGFSDWNSNVRETLNSGRSEISTLNKEDVARKTQQAEARNLAQQNQEIEEGAWAITAGARRLGRDIVDGGAAILENPTALFDAAVEQLPYLATGFVSKAAVSQGAVQAKAAQLAARAGVPVTKEITAQAHRQLFNRNLAGVVGATEASALYSEATNQIVDMPIEAFAQEFPEAAARIAEGEDAATIKRETANQVAGWAAITQLPVAMLTSRLGARFQYNPTGLGNAAPNLVQRAGEQVAAIGGETLEEMIQSGTAAVSQNFATRMAGGVSGDDLLANVGTQMGAGAVVGGAFSGGMQAPAITKLQIDAAAQGVGAVGKAALQGLGNVARSRLDKMTAQAQADIEKQAGSRTQAADNLAAGIQASIPTSEADSSIPSGSASASNSLTNLSSSVSSEKLLTPETATLLQGESAAPMSRIQALAKAVNMFQLGAVPAEQAQNMQLFVARTVRELNQNMEALEPFPELATYARELAEDAVLQEQLEAAKNDPKIADLMAQVSDAVIPEGTPMDPAIAKAIEQVIEISHLAPDKITKSAAERALFMSTDMTPEDRGRMELARDLASQREAYAAEVATLKSANPNSAVTKRIGNVMTEVDKEGWVPNNSKKKGLSQHVTDIFDAVGSNDLKLAQTELTKLFNFANAFQGKLQAFDTAAAQSAALQAQGIDRGRSRVDVINTRGERVVGQLETDNTLGKNLPWVDVNEPGSLTLLRAVELDAQLVGETYNTMVRGLKNTFGDQIVLNEIPLNQFTWNQATAEAPARATTPPTNQEASAPVETAPAVQVATPEVAAVGSAPVIEEVAPVVTEATPVVEQTSIETQEAPRERTHKEWNRKEGQPDLRPSNGRAKFVSGDTSISYTRDGDQVVLELISTPKDKRGKGTARKAINAFLALTDAANTPVNLTVAAIGDTPNSVLAKFYESVGFKFENEALKDVLDTTEETIKMSRPVGGQTTVEQTAETAPEAQTETKQVDPLKEGLLDVVGAPSTGIWVDEDTPPVDTSGETIKPNEAQQAVIEEAIKFLEMVFDVKLPRLAFRIAKYRSPEKTLISYINFSDNIDEITITLAQEIFLGLVDKDSNMYNTSMHVLMHEIVHEIENQIGNIDSVIQAFVEEYALNDKTKKAWFDEYAMTFSEGRERNSEILAEIGGLIFSQGLRFEKAYPKTFAAFNQLLENKDITKEAEQVSEAQVPTKLAERFPGLIQEAPVAEDASPQDKLKAKNQFLLGFELNPNSNSLFTRMLRPVSALVAAFKNGTWKEFLTKDNSWLNPNNQQVDALNQLFAKQVPAIVKQLNLELNKYLTKGGVKVDTTLAQRMEADLAREWSFVNRKSMHVLEKLEDGTYQYVPEIAAAMALAGLHWAINSVANPPAFSEEKLRAAFPGIGKGALYKFQTEHLYSRIVPRLGNEIMQVLGVKPRANAPSDITDGLPKQLAADVVKVLASLNIILEDEVDTPPISDQADVDIKVPKLRFLKFNESTLDGSLAPLRTQLGNPQLLTRIIMPGFAHHAKFGAPFESVPTRTQGSNQKISKKQRKALTNKQNTPAKPNTAYISFMELFGRENFLRWKGFNDADLTSLNKGHARLVQGKNNGLEYQWNSLMSLVELGRQFAQSKDLGEIDMYWGWRQGSNGRAMQNGFGPQADKAAREAFSHVRRTMELNNEQHQRDFMLALAQALGKKVEIKNHKQVIAETEARLFELMPVLGRLQSLMQDDLTPSELVDTQAKLLEDLQAEKIDTDRALNALIQYNKYLAAREEGDSSVSIDLAFELDGKTDGPINGLVHFGLSFLSTDILKQLRQGGLFVNQINQLTLNEQHEADTKLGDLYTNVLVTLEKKLKQAFATDGNQKWMLASLQVLQQMGMVRQNPETGALFLDRNLAKTGVVPKNYAAGDQAVLNKLAASMFDYTYTQLSEAMLNDGALDEGLLENLQVLLEGTESGRKLSNTENYANIEFTADDMKLVAKRLQKSFGGLLVESINQELQPVLETYSVMVQASQYQVYALRKAYDAAAQEMRQKRIEEGTLLENQALSHEDQQSILESLSHLVPAFATSVAAGALQNEGVNIAVNERDNRHKVNGKVQRVNALTGGYSLDINTLSFADPAVRIAALLTIAGGDASMMTEMFSQQNILNALDVYDGLEVGIGDIATVGEKVNAAVLKGWQFDMLGGVRDGFANITFDFANMDPAELQEMGKMVRLDKDDMDPKNIVKALQSHLDNTRDQISMRAARIAAIKKVIFSKPGGVDHMAGAMAGYTYGSDAQVSQDIVAEANQAANEAVAAMDKAATKPVVEEGNKELEKRLGEKGVDGLWTLDYPMVQMLLLTFPFSNKLHKFVVKTINHLIPKEIKVIIGDSAAIAAKQTELFGKPLGGELEVGAQIDNYIFLKVASPETLVHELVHAATIEMIRKFVKDKGVGFKPTQRQAILDLWNLTKAFQTMDFSKEDPTTQKAAKLAQNTVNGHMAAGRNAEATNEFMAWTLSNANLADALTRKEPLTGLKKVAQTVMKFVRRMLGLPANQEIDNFLVQVMQQTRKLAINTPENIWSEMSGDALYQSLNGGTNLKHEQHLESLSQSLKRLWLALPEAKSEAEYTKRLEEFKKGQKIADTITENFIDAGFVFTQRESSLFHNIQAAMAAGIELDPKVMSQFQDLYSQAMKTLTEADFVDPSETGATAKANARKRYEALLAVNTQTQDVRGRSNLLANFVALAQVYQPLRDKLSTMAMPKNEIVGETADQKVRAATVRVFDWLTRKQQDISAAPNQQAALDTLVERLAVNLEKDRKRIAFNQNPVIQGLGTMGNNVRKVTQAAGDLADTTLQRRERAKQNQTNLDRYINGALGAVRAATTEDGAKALVESSVSLINESNLFGPLAKLLTEFLTIPESDFPTIALLDEGKHLVSRARQRLREEVPLQVRKLFTKPLTEDQWASLHTSVAKTDLVALVGRYNPTNLLNLVQDNDARTQEIAQLESTLGKYAGRYIASAKNTAKWMLGGEASTEQFLHRNAVAVSELAGQANRPSNTEAAKHQKTIDSLISLYAMDALEQSQRDNLADLLGTESEAMTALMNIIKSLQQAELVKDNGRLLEIDDGADRHRLNRPKGYSPISEDPRSQVILADTKKAKELLKLGYKKVADYTRDSEDLNGRNLAYYIIERAGGMATFSQGAIQTVEGSVSGLDYLTGRSLDPSVQTMITDRKLVNQITERKQNKSSAAQNNGLIPIFDAEGTVIAYQRKLDANIMKNHTRSKANLSTSIGIWMGRQTEENIARHINQKLVGALVKNWEDGVKKRQSKEYVDIASASADPTVQEAWGAIPREMQQDLLEAFEGKVMIRKNMIDNTIGYRKASIGNMFTGVSDMPQKLRKEISEVAYAFLGPKAYPYLVQAERALQEGVGTAKDWIVVRSGVVALVNMLSNVFAMTQMGVPVRKLPQMLNKVIEAENFLRLEKRLTQIRLELAASTDLAQQNKLKREAASIDDAMKRLGSYDLFMAGLLPTITEGLTEMDEYGVLNDFSEWVQTKTKNLPKGLIDTAKVALIAKDTAVYKGLNRAIQFGDFVSKAVLYDHLISQGMSKADAMREVNSSFVNYNVLPGRVRDALEHSGLTWFLNYKIRVQQTVLRSMRRNPLAFVVAAGAAESIGSDSLYSSSAVETNWEYAVGFDQFWRAGEMNMYRQMLDL